MAIEKLRDISEVKKKKCLREELKIFFSEIILRRSMWYKQELD